jgi:hypothetical protein
MSEHAEPPAALFRIMFCNAAVFAHIWTFKNGKIVKYVQNVDTKKVWDAIEGK